jgi:hypothetical protein
MQENSTQALEALNITQYLLDGNIKHLTGNIILNLREAITSSNISKLGTDSNPVLFAWTIRDILHCYITLVDAGWEYDDALDFCTN